MVWMAMTLWLLALVRLPSHFTLKGALKNTLNIFGVNFFLLTLLFKQVG